MSINVNFGYKTKVFSEIFEDMADFKTQFLASPFGALHPIHYGETVSGVTYPDNVTLVANLLYMRFEGTPIADYDEDLFKSKIFATIWEFGPAWEKRLDIQSKLRNLSETDIMTGSKAIYNSALNPSTAPSTQSLQELTYINQQNTTNYKKSKMEAYGILWEAIKTDVTEAFLSKFKPFFKKFVMPETFTIEDDSED